MNTDLLLSPARHQVRPEGDRLICTGTGRRYAIVNGTPHLFDEMDVSPFLRADFAKFAAAQQLAPDHGGERWADIQAVYRRARFINTEVLFQLPLRLGRVLELGVGEADLIKRFGKLGHEAWALDFFPWEMEKARDAEPVFKTVSAPMSRLPFRTQSFDLVYSHAALHHALPNDHSEFAWSNPHNLVDSLREIARVLKPGGLFLLLGEGLYPEGVTDRNHERLSQSDAGVPYESWYTLSEYERAFLEADIYPALWVDQEHLVARAHTYRNGVRVPLVTEADGITDGNYERMVEKVGPALR